MNQNKYRQWKIDKFAKAAITFTAALTCCTLYLPMKSLNASLALITFAISLALNYTYPLTEVYEESAAAPVAEDDKAD